MIFSENEVEVWKMHPLSLFHSNAEKCHTPSLSLPFVVHLLTSLTNCTRAKSDVRMVAMYYEGKTRIRIQSINAATTSNLILVSSLGLLRWIFRSWYD